MHRSRRSIVIAAVALAGVLGMAGVAAAARGGGSAPKPEDDRSVVTAADTGVVTTAGTAPRVTTVSSPPTTIPPSALPDDHGGDPVGHDDHGDDNTSTSVPGDHPPTTFAPGIPNGVQTFSVAGGTVTVDIENGVLSLVSATPNAGFAIDKSEARSDRVEVEFRGNDTESRVRVRIDGGRLRVETRDN